MIIFISGGVRSGKSTLAEQMAIEIYQEQSAKALYYMATTKRNNDEEMLERIALHQTNRSSIWRTIEEPFRLDQAMEQLENQSVLLIDCLTVWSSNVLFEENKSYETMLERLANAFQVSEQKQLTVILVSNDVNEEIPIADAGVQQYVRSLEEVHKYVVKNANQAIQVIAGSPVRWK